MTYLVACPPDELMAGQAGDTGPATGRGGDKCVSECVGPDRLGQSGAPGDAADAPPGTVTVQPRSGRS